jgi:hypothetical protein
MRGLRGQLWLGHRRLSIIDVLIAARRGPPALVFNGENHNDRRLLGEPAPLPLAAYDRPWPAPGARASSITTRLPEGP